MWSEVDFVFKASFLVLVSVDFSFIKHEIISLSFLMSLAFFQNPPRTTIVAFSRGINLATILILASIRGFNEDQ